ncbi:MAG: peptide deformylase [Candidatus Marinimicrobia bacterium]|nr:peptide deformylase [Candidatus Neomarinimicrobiota bacterium]
MSILKIYLYGSPILSKKVEKVEDLPKSFDKYMDDMFETMLIEDGIGLSANQVGKDIRFFITDFSSHDKNLTKGVFINPVIIESDGKSTLEEGCLSIPDIRQQVTRSETITLQWENVEREVFREEFSGLMARVIQHEMDHLNGIFFVDRITQLKRSFISSKLKRIAASSEKSDENKLSH